MRIKKVSQYIEGGANLSNVYGTSNENGYTQEYINNTNTYSTTEKEIGTWEKLDGTIVPLYRRIWYRTLTSSDTYPLYFDVGMNGSFMTKVDVSLTTSNNVKAPLPYYLASNNYGVWNTNLNRILYDAKGTFFTDGTLTIIIEYIK